MNVTLEKTGNVTAVVTIQVAEEDYIKKVKEDLRWYGLHRAPKGFRPGKVPARLLEAKYGEALRADVVDEVVSKALFDYLRENKVNILARPFMNESTKVDFKNDREYEFKFDVGLAPELALDIKKVEIPYYKISVSDAMVADRCEAYRKRFSKVVDGEVSALDSMVRGSIDELDASGEVKTDGIKAERSVISPQYLKDDVEGEKFVGLKVGDTVTFNPFTATGGSEVELAAMLNKEKAEVANLKSDFVFTVEEIKVHEPAALDQEFFDSVLGKDVAKSEEEFMEKLRETIAGELVSEGNYRFAIDARERLLEAVGDVELPDELIRRFLLARDKELTPEKLEQDYPESRKDVVWQLIKGKVEEEAKLEVSDDDLKNLARIYAAQQFANYGMSNLPEDVLDRYAGEMLEKSETREALETRAMDDKVFGAIRAMALVTERSVDEEEYKNLYGKNDDDKADDDKKKK